MHALAHCAPSDMATLAQMLAVGVEQRKPALVQYAGAIARSESSACGGGQAGQGELAAGSDSAVVCTQWFLPPTLQPPSEEEARRAGARAESESDISDIDEPAEGNGHGREQGLRPSLRRQSSAGTGGASAGEQAVVERLPFGWGVTKRSLVEWDIFVRDVPVREGCAAEPAVPPTLIAADAVATAEFPRTPAERRAPRSECPGRLCARCIRGAGGGCAVRSWLIAAEQLRGRASSCWVSFPEAQTGTWRAGEQGGTDRPRCGEQWGFTNRALVASWRRWRRK